MYTGSVGDVRRPAAEHSCVVRAPYVNPTLAEYRLEPRSFSGAAVRHPGFHRSLNTLAGRAVCPTVAQRFGGPDEFRDPRELRDPQGPNSRCIDSPQIPRGSTNARSSVRAIKERRESSPRLRDPPECRRSSGLDGQRRRADRHDDPHRPHSNLAAAAAFPDAATWAGGEDGRATSASLGSTGAVQRVPVRFASMPDLAARRQRRSTGGSDDVGELSDWESAGSKCHDRSSTFISMPCISSCRGHYRRGAGRGSTPKRFLPTLSIPEEVSESSIYWGALNHAYNTVIVITIGSHVQDVPSVL